MRYDPKGIYTRLTNYQIEVLNSLKVCRDDDKNAELERRLREGLSLEDMAEWKPEKEKDEKDI